MSIPAGNGAAVIACQGKPLYPDRPSPTPTVEVRIVGTRPLRDAETVITYANGDVHRFRTTFKVEEHPLRLGSNWEIVAELIDATGASFGSVHFSRTTRDGSRPSEEELLFGANTRGDLSHFASASVNLRFGTDSVYYSLACPSS